MSLSKKIQTKVSQDVQPFCYWWSILAFVETYYLIDNNIIMIIIKKIILKFVAFFVFLVCSFLEAKMIPDPVILDLENSGSYFLGFSVNQDQVILDLDIQDPIIRIFI